MSDGALQVRVVSPARVVFDGPASALVAPSWDGQVGVLPGHAPMLTLLGAGPLNVEHQKGGSDVFYVAGGVMKVEGNVVTLLTEYADESPPESLPDGLDLDFDDLDD